MIANHFVLDSGAIIKGLNSPKIFENYQNIKLWTIPEVVDEIRDERARSLLETFPLDIEILSPTPESLFNILEFSKKTGDYVSLSKVDLNVIALTFQIKRDFVDNITKKKKRRKRKSKKKSRDLTPEMIMNEDKVNFCKVEDENRQFPDKETFIEKDESFGEWITPDNLEQVTQHINRTSLKEKPATNTVFNKNQIKVGCMTTDFAMQNVLLQLGGLKVFSIDGMLIKKCKTWVLKCFGCFELVRDNEKIFCPACGGNTLKKVAVQVDSSGTFREFNLPPQNIRGTKFSIPKPKGGRKANDLIYAEDQILNSIKLKKKQKEKMKKKGSKDLHLSQEQFFFGDPRTTLQGKDIKIEYGSRNPNVARKNCGKSNKSFSK